MWIFTITYNFDIAYIAKKCETQEEAFAMLNKYLQEEIECVKTESGYTPSVLEWHAGDVTLVYAEGYSMENLERNYGQEDCAEYRIFKVNE